ncbi:MAG: metal ABC transporter permease [Candidatus Dormibacteraeota bacterium]|nr:metal ABC transporter permease [Candidatus Dormibacteraeota bacterium]MBV9525018.1 metal ABC transporter permease [Candidatus Dormibacteraeota bacterium]
MVRDIAQLFDYDFSRHAFAAGTVVAVVAGAVGYFVVLRALAFGAHALSHIGFAGAAGAGVVGADAVVGMLLFTVGGGSAIGLLGTRVRERDVAIGTVLAFMLGLGALFLQLYRGNVNNTYALLFGDIYGVSALALLITLAAGAATLLALACIYRPLLFASLDDEVAAARGVPVRAVGVMFMVLLALAVSDAVQVVGVLLVFGLLVTPAAISERLTARPARGLLLSSLLALLFTWLGLAVAYYAPGPPSFYITTFSFVTYVAVRVGTGMRERARGALPVLESL